MIEKIKELERLSSQLSPDASEREELRAKAIKISEAFLEELPTLNAYNSEKADTNYFSEATIVPDSWDAILSAIDDEVVKPGINAASGKHLGYIPGGGIFLSSIADYLAAAINKYAGVFYASPGAVRMENQLIQWMGKLVGYDEGFAGNLASGGSIANLTAVVTARDAFQIKGKDVEKIVIYASEQMHHCLNKAFRIAGLAEAKINYIPLDSEFRMDSEKLSDQIRLDRSAGLVPWLVVASAGSTDTGVIDPLQDLGEIANEENLWFHVDAAYGGFFLLCDDFKSKFKGIELADSLVMDPHKGMFIPYGLGAVLVKNGKKLYDSHNYQANYMQDTYESMAELSPSDLSPELSKHFRGLRMWLPLKLYGEDPFKACLEEKIWLTRYFYEAIGNIDGIERGPFPDLSVMYFRYIPEDGDANEFNEKLVRSIQEDGRVFLSSTVIDGKFVIRLAVLSFRTHLREIDLALEIIKEKISELTK